MMPSLFPRDAVFTVPGPSLELAGGSWIFRFPRELKSLNRTFWNHWRNAQRERQAWELEFRGAVHAFACVRTVEGWSLDDVQAFRVLTHQREIRRVRVFRLVPHAKYFIRDDDNLAASTKHLLDAMKGVGLIYDDSRTWLERRTPTQAIADDGQFWTVVQLDRPDVRDAWERR